MQPSNLTLQNLVEFWLNPHGTKPQTSPDRWWKSGGTLVEPLLKPPRLEACEGLVETWWKPGGTLVEPNLKPPGPPSPRGTLVEPWWNPGTVVETSPDPQPLKKLLEPWWNLVEPYLKPPRTTLQPWWNPRNLFQTSPDHPTALEEIGGTLVEPSWNLKPPGPSRSPCRTWWMVEPWWNPGGTLVEPWWNPGGTSAQGRPEPPWSLSGLRPQSFQLLGKNKKTKTHAMAFFKSESGNPPSTGSLPRALAHPHPTQKKSEEKIPRRARGAEGQLREQGLLEALLASSRSRRRGLKNPRRGGRKNCGLGSRKWHKLGPPNRG